MSGQDWGTEILGQLACFGVRNVKFGQVMMKIVMLNFWEFVVQRLDSWAVEVVTVRSQALEAELSDRLGCFGV